MPTMFRLANGVTCVYEHRPGIGFAEMQIAVKYGSADDALSESGFTYLVQECLNGGTITRTRRQIYEQAASRGVEIATEADREKVVLSALAQTHEIEWSLSLLADMLVHPSFKPSEIKKTKSHVMDAIDARAQDSEEYNRDKFFATGFGDQAFGAPVLGTKENIAAFTPDQIKQKHSKLLNPKNIVISVVGDLASLELERLAQENFSSLPSGLDMTSQVLVQFKGGDHREVQEVSQLKVMLGFPAPALSDANRLAFLVLEEFLDGTMASPLSKLREDLGVYNVHADYQAFSATGVFQIWSGMDGKKATGFLDGVLKILGQVARHGLTAEQLELTRKHLLRGIEAKLERSKSACKRNADQILNFGRTFSLAELREQLSRLTVADVQHACAALLASPEYALSVVGPRNNMPSQKVIESKRAAQTAGIVLPSANQFLAAPALQTSFTQQAAAPANLPDNHPPCVTTLSNGLKFIFVQKPGTVAFDLRFTVGSDDELPEQNGISHALEHMVFKGGPTLRPGDVENIIQVQLAGDLNACTDKNYTAYHASCLAPEDLRKALTPFFEMVLQPRLGAIDFKGGTSIDSKGKPKIEIGECDVVLDEIIMYEDDIENRAACLLDATAYPGQPHGRPILGTHKTLNAMNDDMLRAYHQKYVPNNAVFTIVGPLDYAETLSLVEEFLGRLKPAPISEPARVEYRGGAAVAEMKANLCSLFLAAEGVAQTHRDSFAYDILGEILGGGESSRLYSEIVDKEELTSNVDAEHESYHHNGKFIIMSKEITAEKCRPFIKAAYAELRNIEHDLTNNELNKIKKQIKTTALATTEANVDVCNFYAGQIAQDQPYTVVELMAQLDRVTLGDIRRVAENILASPPTMSIIAPFGTSPFYFPDHTELLDLRDGKKPPGPMPMLACA